MYNVPREMSDKKYNFKRIPAECLNEIYQGWSDELLKQPYGKKNFRKALVSWKNTGALHKLHKKYSQFTSAKNTEVEWDGKSQYMIPYNRIQEIYNEVRKKYGPLGNPKINLWNRGDQEFKKYNELIVKGIKKGKRVSFGKKFSIKIK